MLLSPPWFERYCKENNDISTFIYQLPFIGNIGIEIWGVNSKVAHSLIGVLSGHRVTRRSKEAIKAGTQVFNIMKEIKFGRYREDNLDLALTTGMELDIPLCLSDMISILEIKNPEALSSLLFSELFQRLIEKEEL